MDSVVEFLKTIRPDGPWLIWVKVPDGACFTRTFNPGQEDALNKLIADNVDSNNLYFLLNHPLGDFNGTKNPEKHEIKFMEWVHVDIDPDHRQNINDQRTAILSTLQGYSPKPSIIVDSGGGYQAYWRLETPCPVVQDNISELEAYNKYLEKYFHADHCHNLNRLMRLPFTNNFPDARKRSRGRVPTKTGLVEINDSKYPIKSFIQADVVADNITVGQADIIDFGNLEKVDVDLLTQLKPKTIEIIKEGHKAFGKASRSEAVFFVVVELIKAKCSDETIAAILLDKSYKISEHIYDTARDPESCVKRTLHNAKIRIRDKEVAELNEKYCIVMDGGKVFVFEEAFNPELGYTEVRRMRPAEFTIFNAHRKKDLGDGKSMPLTKYWMQHPDKRYFNNVVFMPNKIVPDAYNLWRGFEYTPSPNGSWDKFKQHIFNIICEGNPKYFEYMMGWMARAVQKPDLPGEAAVVFRGRKGTGKTFFGKMFGRLFGTHYRSLSRDDHVIGNFNSQIRNVVVLLAEEAFFAGDKKGDNALKELITGEHLNIEYKGVDLQKAKNCIHLIMVSNDDWIIPASEDERRYFVVDVKSDHRQDDEYFDDIEKELLNGGFEAMLYELQTRDISKYNPRKIPQTGALDDQKMHSLKAEFKWWLEKLNEGQITPTHVVWGEPVDAREVVDDYSETCRRMGVRYQKASLDAFFRKVLPTGRAPDRTYRTVIDESYTGVRKQKRVPLYIFPNLNDCREAFCKATNIHVEWSEIIDNYDTTTAYEKSIAKAF